MIVILKYNLNINVLYDIFFLERGKKMDTINTILTNNQIKAVFNLYNYGFLVEEITDMANGKNLFDVINTKIDILLERILDYINDLYYKNQFCLNVDVEKELKNGTVDKNIIIPLIKLQQKIIKDFDIPENEIFERKIEVVIDIINNIEKVQNEYSELINGKNSEIKVGKNQIFNTINYTMFKKDVMYTVKSKPIITKEQWKQVNEKLKHN